MPSIPQSLLWISLVVLWLFVLVPMLVSKRENVRRTSDVALATRVLNSGRGARLLRRRGPAAGHYSDPHWKHTTDADEYDDFDGDDGVTAPHKAVVLAAPAAAPGPDYLDVDVVEEDSGALPIGDSANELMLDLDLPGGTGDELGSQLGEPAPECADPADPATQAIRTVSDADFEADGTEAEAVDDDVNSNEAYSAEEPEQPAEPARPDGTDHDYEYVPDSSGLEAPSEDEVPLAQSMSQARRQRYESKTAAAVSARKFRFRKRMLLGMGIALVVTAALAFVVSPSMWWACGTVGAITLLYLAYLRRQTRIEEQLRRRRAQRLARSRLGVESTDDSEFDVVPARLRRPGAVVLDIDDEDPIFEHLEYASYGEYHLPRAAGE